MMRRRAMAADIETEIGCQCHTFRATSITAYLENGGTLEHAQQTCPPKTLCRRWIAAHESPRTTKLYYAQSAEMCGGRRKLVITGRRAWADST
jgi:hypothetical protein